MTGHHLAMSLFHRLRDDARFAAGAWRALRHTVPIAKNPTRIFPTLIEELAARYGDKPALISDIETLTYRELDRARQPAMRAGRWRRASARARSSAC